MQTDSNQIRLLVPALLAAALALIAPASAWAADSAVLSVPSEPRDQPTFTIGTAQTVQWEAFVRAPITSQNKLVLVNHEVGEAPVQLAVLVEGLNQGEVRLDAGTYSIDSNLGPGVYSVEYNRTARLALNPASLSFGRLAPGQSATKSATVRAEGDDGLAVTLAGTTSSDPARFQVVDHPSGELPVGTAGTLEIRFVAAAADAAHQASITVAGTTAAGPTEAVLLATGETRVPKPDVDCPSVTRLGEADWSLDEIEDLTFTFQNRGDAPLEQTGEVELHSDVPDVFTWPSGPPSWPSVSGDRSRNLTVRFRPVAEATYRGRLVLNSNDPDEAAKNCTIEARGHHPVPRAEFRDTGIDFGEVQLGFRFTRFLGVANEGDAELVLDINAVAAGEGDPWPELPLGRFRVAPGDEALQKAVFHPLFTGPRRIDLEVATNEEPPRRIAVQLTGTGVTPTPIDSVLLLDRSASMNQVAGLEGTKIEALSRAASLYTELLRADIPDSGTSDRLGLVRYNQGRDTLLELRPIDDLAAGGHRAEALTRLADTGGRLRPDGATGIGGALDHGAGMLDPGDDGRSRVMVVMTDGRENRNPEIAEVLPDVLERDPDLALYSVGLGGDETINADLLQELARASDGKFYQVTDLAGVRIYDLERFYFDIFRRARRLQGVEDGFQLATVAGDEPAVVEEVTLHRSDRSAEFLVILPDFSAFLPGDRPPPTFAVELLDPHGRRITPATAVADASVEVLERPRFTRYRLVFPDAEEDDAYAGTWRVLVRLELSPGSPSIEIPLPLAVAVAVGSDFALDAVVLPAGPLPGAEVTLRASLTDRGAPAPAGTVWVDVLTPLGRTARLRLHDDATSGDDAAGDARWTGRFLDTGEEGTYRFRFEATGRTLRGETGRRVETRWLYLGRPTGGEDDPTARRLFGSLHAGIASPERGFDSDTGEAEQGTYAQLDLTWLLDDGLALRAMLGGFDLPDAAQPRWGHLSLGLKRDLDTRNATWWPYLQLAPGLYRPDGGPSEFGLTLGAGIEWALDPPLTFVVGADWHRIAAANDLDIVVVHVGLTF